MSTNIRPGITKKSQVAPTVDTATDHTSGSVAVVVGPRPQPLVPGSMTAKALARVWRGGELTIVDAPPGSGKTSLVSNIVANLATRTDMHILVTTPTRAQCLAFARRLSLELPVERILIDMKDIEPEDLPGGPTPQIGPSPRYRSSPSRRSPRPSSSTSPTSTY
ncbi:Superfamily I DNA and RNA helicase and helicase subunits-like protein [mine drainage metagenome]|uniref:Superfamily I DNA and RNA helicase and helicase subunits-like protein n=1 Tax=mine drainage metagenome TaxID=410659 RepID=T1BVV6_9ZZZZ